MGGGGEGGRKADNVRWYDRIVSPRSMIYRKSIDHLRNQELNVSIKVRRLRGNKRKKRQRIKKKNEGSKGGEEEKEKEKVMDDACTLQLSRKHAFGLLPG